MARRLTGWSEILRYAQNDTKPRTSFKETHSVAEDFNHSIDLLYGVVKIEARTSCPRHAEPVHQRLIAMMSTAHGQPVLVRERCEIVRMRRVHDKPNKCAALFYWPENARPRQVCETLRRVARKLRVVF